MVSLFVPFDSLTTLKTSGQVEPTYRGLKRIGETVGENRASGQIKLDDGIIAFRTALQDSNDVTPYPSTDKSEITRKQSKASKHGHENQKSTKPKPEKSSLSQIQCPQLDQTATIDAWMIEEMNG
ncbi:hypothetical protein Tco_0415257 [Tanacetum coccineum]